MSIFEGLTPPYSTIVADPPWHYGERIGRTGDDPCVAKPMPYSTMSATEIAALPVGVLAAPGCHLYLWTTNLYLETSFGVARAWGFEPSQVLTWCKPTDRVSPGGGLFFGTTEFVVFARYSTTEPPTRVGRVIQAAREKSGLSRQDIHRLVRGGRLTGLVANWELDLSLPNPVDWSRLCEVLPDLLGVPRPDIPKDRFKGHTRVPTTWWLWPRGPHSVKPAAFLDVVEQASPDPYVELFARAPRLGWDSWGKGYEMGETA